MSTSFNYNAPGAARSYDEMKSPVGADVVAGLIYIHCGKPLKVCLVKSIG